MYTVYVNCNSSIDKVGQESFYVSLTILFTTVAVTATVNV